MRPSAVLQRVTTRATSGAMRNPTSRLSAPPVRGTFCTNKKRPEDTLPGPFGWSPRTAETAYLELESRKKIEKKEKSEFFNKEPPHLSGGHRFRCSGFVLASWRTAPALFFRHPSWRASPSAAAATGQALQTLDRFLQVFSFLF